MKKVFTAILSLTIALGMLASPASAAPGGFVNPSFEPGLVGWTTVIPPGGSAVSVTDHGGFYPVHGNRFALLKADGPGSYTTLSQTFTVQAGDSISGWAFFQANDVAPFNDNAQVRIMQGDTVIATVFGGSVVNTGTRPWTFWAYAFPTDGAYTLQARIANGGIPGGGDHNSGFDSYMGLDLIVFRVDVDFKPGDDQNTVNLDSNGVVPVALLTTPIFDAALVDTASVKFAEASPVNQSLEDVDGDGDLDYLFHFRTEDLAPEGPNYAQFKARTVLGYFIGGRDTLNLVPHPKR